MDRSRSIENIYSAISRPRSPSYRLRYVVDPRPRRSYSVDDMKRAVDVAQANLWMGTLANTNVRASLPNLAVSHTPSSQLYMTHVTPKPCPRSVRTYPWEDWQHLRGPMAKRQWRRYVDPDYRNPLWYGYRPWVWETDSIARATKMFEQGSIGMDQLEKYWTLPYYSPWRPWRYYPQPQQYDSTPSSMGADAANAEYWDSMTRSCYDGMAYRNDLEPSQYRRRTHRALLDDNDYYRRNQWVTKHADDVHRRYSWVSTPTGLSYSAWLMGRPLFVEPGVMRSYTNASVARYYRYVPTYWQRYVDLDYSSPLWYGRRVWDRPTSDLRRAVDLYRSGAISRSALHGYSQRPVFHTLYNNYSARYSPHWAYINN